VRLGLARASFLGIVLLTAGAILSGTAFLLEWAYEQRLLLSVFLLAIPVAVFIVLRKIKRLYSLSKEQVASKNSRSVEQEIVSLSAQNPQWIMLVTQTYSLMSIILFTSKFLL
jgi:hypothetical protein